MTWGLNRPKVVQLLGSTTPLEKCFKLQRKSNVKKKPCNSKLFAKIILCFFFQDKLACHDLYISFLKSVGLWNRLSAVTVRGKPMPTALSLSEHNEKNIAAVTLR